MFKCIYPVLYYSITANLYILLALS